MNTRHYRSRLSLLRIMVVAACASVAPLVDREATAPELPGFGVVQMNVTTNVPAARQWYLSSCRAGLESVGVFRTLLQRTTGRSATLMTDSDRPVTELVWVRGHGESAA